MPLHLPRKRVRQLHRTLRICANFLPARGSLIAQLICMEVLHAEAMGVELSIKELFANTGYSVSGCRAQLALLRAQGFVRTVRSPLDKRRQIVRSADALLVRAEQMLRQLEKERD